MMSQIKVSVIMPVYNAADFLNDTLRDVTGQTLKDIEIICVDDGSKDSSREIVSKWQEKDNRIQLVIQQNQYAGVARNNGFARAKGKYVVFWDSDDIFCDTALEKLYQQLEKTGADVCVCGARRYDMENDRYIPSKAYLKRDLLPEKEVFSKKDTEYIFDFATNNPWNKMYLADFIRRHNLQFQVIKQANDTYFTMMALFLAEKITYVDEVLISYRVNNAGSLTGKASDTVFCAYESYVYTMERMEKYPEFSLVKKSFRNHALNGFFHALNNQRSFVSYEKLYNKLAEEGFAYFGMDKAPVEDYMHAWQHRDMLKVMSMPATEFLLQKSEERRLNAERFKTEKEYEQTRRREERERLVGEIARIRASKTFRVGKMIMGIPSAIKGIFIKK